MRPVPLLAASLLATTLLATGLLAPSDPAAADDSPATVIPNQSAQDLVTALHTAFGEHHVRAVHSKGIVLEGSFIAAPEAKDLCKEAIFDGAGHPATIRFSDFTGLPEIPDTAGQANPRGLAIRIKAGDEAPVDLVTHSYNGFPTATADEFAALLRSIAASGPDTPHPTAVEPFLAVHPIAKTFLTSQKPAPVSFATLSYFGVNSFKFTNAAGESHYVRSRFLPLAGEQFLSADDLKQRGPNYLREEITARVAKAPILFDWYAQIAEPGDQIEDPSTAWPESRKLVKLGTLTITMAAADQETADRRSIFIPGFVHPGIEAADPMLAIRDKAYPISFSERQ